MIIPVFVEDKPVDKTGDWNPSWKGVWEHLFQNMQISIGQEGYLIPSISSDPNSVTPPTSGGQLLQVQNSFSQQNGAQKGTLVFDPAEINGGSSMQPNGQLKILLGDGTFHAIANL